MKHLSIFILVLLANLTHAQDAKKQRLNAAGDPLPRNPAPLWHAPKPVLVLCMTASCSPPPIVMAEFICGTLKPARISSTDRSAGNASLFHRTVNGSRLAKMPPWSYAICTRTKPQTCRTSSLHVPSPLRRSSRPLRSPPQISMMWAYSTSIAAKKYGALPASGTHLPLPPSRLARMASSLLPPQSRSSSQTRRMTSRSSVSSSGTRSRAPSSSRSITPASKFVISLSCRNKRLISQMGTLVAWNATIGERINGRR